MRILCCLLLIAVLGACSGGAGRVARAPVQAPPPPTAPPEAAPAGAPVRVCVVRDGELAEVEAVYRPATGDTLVGGRPFSQVYPASSPPYAAGTDWYVRHRPLVFRGRLYTKYGLARMIPAEALQRVGEYRGLPVFAAAESAEEPTVFYVPVRPGCEFQPYQNVITAGAVHGGWGLGAPFLRP